MNLRVLLPWGAAITVGCALLQPRFEAVDPEYGYVDGCTDLVLQGAEIGENATVTIGGVPVLGLEPATLDPDYPEWAQDVGFKYYAVSPPSPGLEPGYYDVVMTIPAEKTGGEPVVRTLRDGFYYLACPGSVHLDEVGFSNPVAPGTTVPLVGCGLDPEQVTVTLQTSAGTVAATMPLQGDCSTAQAHVDLPASLAAGVYFLTLEHADGTLIGGVCSEWQDTGGLLPVDTDPETDLPVVDTDGGTGLADTGAPCDGTWPIYVGGAP